MKSKQVSEFKESEIGKIPSDWEIKKLEELIFIKGRIGWKGLKKSEFTKEGIIIINGPQIKNGKVNWNQCLRVPTWRHDESKEISVKKGDILMTKDGTIGKMAYVRHLPESATLASGIFLIRSNSEKLDQRFLYYYFNSKFFNKLVESRIEGSVIPHLYQRDIVQLSIPLPSISEQQSIAKITFDINSKIENLQNQNKILEQISQAIFKSWFVDFEFPDGEGKPYKFSGGKMVYNEDIGQEIPENWDVKTISSFGKVICGKTPLKSNNEFFNGDTPFIKIPNMHDQLFILSTTDSLSEKGKKLQENKTLPKGSICVSCIATVGVVSITSKESQTNQQINSIIPYHDHLRYYLFYKMKSIKQHLKDLGSSGTTTFNVNTTTFSNIKIIYPKEELIKKFDAIIQGMFNRLLSNSIETESLKQILSLLLPKLLSGKIRLSKEKY